MTMRWPVGGGLLDYYRRMKRIYDDAMDMMGHDVPAPRIVYGNTDSPSPTDSPGPTEASAAEPILISGANGER